MADKGTPTGREKNTFQPVRSDGRKKKQKRRPSHPQANGSGKVPSEFQDDVMGAILGALIGLVAGLVACIFYGVSPLGLFFGDGIVLFMLIGAFLGYMYRRSASDGDDGWWIDWPWD